MVTSADFEHIGTAVEQAKLSVQEDERPKPRVGAVAVKNGKVLGTAFRGEVQPGQHAEYVLLEVKLKYADVSGGTLYTTLEPCTVRGAGKIPCAERIADRRLARVVIGILDPNQLICGKGVRYLRDRGIEIDLFPTEFVQSVEDQNREFVRDRERVEKIVLHDAALNQTAILINPRFDGDLRKLDRTFELESIANTDTVFIIAGETIVSELLDRVTCGLLRDAIDAEGLPDPFKRALIVSAKTWGASAWLTQKCPALSIGGEAPNRVTKELLARAQEKKVTPFRLGSGFGVYLSEPRPRAALYGPNAEDTAAAVQRYITEPRGLREFLQSSWR